MKIFDPRTGRIEGPATDEELQEARDYVERTMEDPCVCPVVPEPHHHAPDAYVSFENGTFGWFGG